MARPTPTFLTIPLEVRNKIYGYALEPGEFQVCESRSSPTSGALWFRLRQKILLFKFPYFCWKKEFEVVLS